ncbi:unnamed protein product [Staurois parvus]|uniref:Uncharacterized protein n=1 Tax=Staurois parvus TaxID=386267 RepID=A0ABN9C0D7_9NEOB|nr:unnamed protein product [Staurois parvus]
MWIQIELNTGTDMNVSLLADNRTLAESSVQTGEPAHNLTLDTASQHLIGPGSHHLQIVASSDHTSIRLNTSITVQLMEAISGLQGQLSTTRLEAGKELQINVSVSHGAPVELKIEFKGSNGTFSHSKECPTGQTQISNISLNVEGTYMVTIIAANLVSNASLDIGYIIIITNSTLHEGMQDRDRGKGHEMKDIIKKKWAMQIEPRRHVNPFSNISLQVWSNITDTIIWSCGYCWSGWFECLKQNLIDPTSKKIAIPAAYLPPPLTLHSLSKLLQFSVMERQCRMNNASM